MQTSGSPLTIFVSSGVKSAPPAENPSGSARIISGSGVLLAFPVFKCVMIVQFFALAIGGSSFASIFLGNST